MEERSICAIPSVLGSTFLVVSSGGDDVQGRFCVCRRDTTHTGRVFTSCEPCKGLCMSLGNTHSLALKDTSFRPGFYARINLEDTLPRSPPDLDSCS